MAKSDRQILLLGATGKLGQELVHQFGEDRIIFRTRETLDITDYVRVRKLIAESKPAVVINAAAYTDWITAERDRERAWRTNTGAVDNLMKGCAEHHSAFLHLSTGNVFGNAAGRTIPKPLVESDPVHPVNWHDQTKLGGELSVIGLGQNVGHICWKHGFRYWLIRTSALIERPAFHGRSEIGQLVSAALASRANKPQTIPDDIFRSYTYVPHLARSIVWLVTHQDEVVNGVYHIANRGALTPFDVMSLIKRRLGKKMSFVRGPLEIAARAYGIEENKIPRYTALNCNKWQDIYPETIPTVEEAIEEYVDGLMCVA